MIEFGKKYGKMWYVLSHSDTFEDVNVKKISIREMKDILSDRVIEDMNVYKYMYENGFQDNRKTIVDVYKGVWLNV